MSLPRVVRFAGREFKVAFDRDGSGRLLAHVDAADGERHRVEVVPGGSGRLMLDGVPFEYRLMRDPAGSSALEWGGESWPIEILTEGEAALTRSAVDSEARDRKLAVSAPMPGRLLAVEVAEGERVAPGAGLFIIEAMKMENEVRAPRAGRVRNLSVAEGDTVEQGQRLCELHSADEPESARRT